MKSVTRFLYGNYPARLVVLLVSLMFVLSLLLPVFRYVDAQWTYMDIPAEVRLAHIRYYYGFEVLLLGWLGVFTGTIGWHANLGLFVTAMTYLKQTRICLPWAYGSLAVACSSFSFRKIRDIDGGRDESTHIIGREAGFYVWLAIFVVMLIACHVQVMTKGRGQEK